MSSKAWVLLIPIGVGLLLILNKEQKEELPNPSMGKEKYYLKFNKDEVFKNLIATEGHFRNIEETGVDREGFLNCAVKHLADAEGHLDEAVSHSLIAENEASSKRFRDLRNEVRELRGDLQLGQVSPEEGIKRVRQARRSFETFNPEYDVSLCEACTVKVEVIKPPQAT